ncbi:aromatic amino acid lyase [Burkholderia sp. Cy-647]|uniref:aromatic amino acid lyase n=1 Tax=Burkholderia sp. Cy-647 TaxID=2608328 RepID=UPI0031F58838
MKISRRQFLALTAAGLAGAPPLALAAAPAAGDAADASAASPPAAPAASAAAPASQASAPSLADLADPPVWPGAEWERIDPDKLGWSPDDLDDVHAYAASIGTASLLIVQHGRVVDSFGEIAARREINSVRKSLLSALIGIAVAEGKIDLDATLGSLGIDDRPPALSQAEKQATVRELLQARSGVYHPALYETAGEKRLRPARGSHAPGSFWYYNNWDFNVLGTIYEHAVGASIALAMDSLTIAVAQVAAMAERRVDRLVNPLVSGLPAFLAQASGTRSGFMIAQYTAAALVAQNRREAAPASLDGGVTSGLQEDHLCHATPAALKALAVIENSCRILGIELLAAAQAYDLQPVEAPRAAYTDRLYARIRHDVAFYRDDRPLADDITLAFGLIAHGEPPPLPDPVKVRPVDGTLVADAAPPSAGGPLASANDVLPAAIGG